VSDLVADGLIIQRDSLAGPFGSLPFKIPKLGQDGEENIEHWSPAVRADILDFLLQSPLAFQVNTQELEVNYKKGDDFPADLHIEPRSVFSLWHLTSHSPEKVPGLPTNQYPTLPDNPLVAASRLAQMVRPARLGFDKQMRFLNGYAALRNERRAEILSQVDSMTPYLGSVVGLRQDRSMWTIELLDAVLRLARQVEMRFKAALACRRPGELSPDIQPMIATPAHSSLPSGHATEAFAMATVLNAIVRLGRAKGPGGAKIAEEESWKDYSRMLSMVAARIAINRTVAGVHFPVDSVAGCTLGVTIGQYFLWRCGAQKVSDTGVPETVTDAAGKEIPVVVDYQAWMFEAWGYDGFEDFSRQLQIASEKGEIHLKEAKHGTVTDPRSGRLIDTPFQYRLIQDANPQRPDAPVLASIFRKAVAEWKL
jgi:hypothetical protein